MRPRLLLLGGVVVSGAIVSWALLSEDGWPRSRQLEGERAALEAKAARLRAENTELAEQAQALQDTGDKNPVLERVVRTELGYVKKDEVIVLPPAAEPAP